MQVTESLHTHDCLCGGVQHPYECYLHGKDYGFVVYHIHLHRFADPLAMGIMLAVSVHQAVAAVPRLFV
jgi:hypothetical protein